ncbi:MAG: phosphatidylserine decarboxylase family protein [Fidelibacterota bacterium]|nr:MAG: phosphatidylserine decarboxylase family protein [Candidatus Neomarinimicrobiota bacterium]
MAPEGRIILIPLLVVVIVSNLGLLWLAYPWLSGTVGLLWVLVGISFIFFRDPVRQLPEDSQAVVSPADGKVVAIQPIDQDEYIGSGAVQISIFLSLFNVHAQRVPSDATVVATSYRRGRFLAAFKSGASKENEQAITHFTREGSKFTVKQIAGFIARRIICYMAPNSAARRGDRLGFIRFGSRVDLIVPADFQLLVQAGMRVKGATTIIGYFVS